MRCKHGIGVITPSSVAAEFDLDEAEIKPYFELSNTINASFDVAGRLFGLQFEPIELTISHRLQIMA